MKGDLLRLFTTQLQSDHQKKLRMCLNLVPQSTVNRNLLPRKDGGGVDGERRDRKVSPTLRHTHTDTHTRVCTNALTRTTKEGIT